MARPTSAGRLCRWVHRGGDDRRRDDEFNTFERFRNSLEYQCEEGDAAVLEVSSAHAPLCHCSGSVGSVCFWASRIRIRIRLSQVLIRMRIWLHVQILPFSDKSQRTEIMVAKINFDTKTFTKNLILIVKHIFTVLKAFKFHLLKKRDFY